jgi:hypothetical protein
MPSNVAPLFESCVGQFSGSTESRDSFGIALNPNSSAFISAQA